MDCKAVQEQLEHAFDEGSALSESLQQHIRACKGCAAYQQQLEAFDVLLQAAPDLAPEPELVARIQASIAAQPALPRFAWSHVAAAVAALAALTGGGWFLDLGRLLTQAQWSYAMPERPVLLDWHLLQTEATNLPVAMLGLVQTTLAWLANLWAAGNATIASVLGTDTPWLGPVVAVCLIGALALNLAEALRSQRNNHMHSE